jgi:uncharacterized protein (UPF0335 family)
MTDNVTAAELLQFIERAEQLAAEKKDIADQEKELRAELTGRGYDAKAFREVLRLRKMKPDDRAEFEAVVQMYRDAAGVA